MRALEPCRAILAPTTSCSRSTDVSASPPRASRTARGTQPRVHARRGRGRRDRRSVVVRASASAAGRRRRGAASPRSRSALASRPASRPEARPRAAGASRRATRAAPRAPGEARWPRLPRPRRRDRPPSAGRRRARGARPRRARPSSRRLSLRSRPSSLHLDPQGGGRGGSPPRVGAAGGGVTEPLVRARLVRVEPGGREQLAAALLVLVRRVSAPASRGRARSSASARRRRRPRAASDERDRWRAAIPTLTAPRIAASASTPASAERRPPGGASSPVRSPGARAGARCIALDSPSAVAVGPVAVGLVHRDDAVDLAQARLGLGERGLGLVGRRRARSARSGCRRARIDGLLELAERGRLDRRWRPRARSACARARRAAPRAVRRAGATPRSRRAVRPLALARELAEAALRVRRPRARPSRAASAAPSISARARSAARSSSARRDAPRRARAAAGACSSGPCRSRRAGRRGSRPRGWPTRSARCLRGPTRARRRPRPPRRRSRRARPGARRGCARRRRARCRACRCAARRRRRRGSLRCSHSPVSRVASRRNDVRPLRSQSIRSATPPALRVTIATRYGPPSQGAKRSRRRSASCSRRRSVLEKQPNSAVAIAWCSVLLPASLSPRDDVQALVQLDGEVAEPAEAADLDALNPHRRAPSGRRARADPGARRVEVEVAARGLGRCATSSMRSANRPSTVGCRASASRSIAGLRPSRTASAANPSPSRRASSAVRTSQTGSISPAIVAVSVRPASRCGAISARESAPRARRPSRRR